MLIGVAALAGMTGAALQNSKSMTTKTVTPHSVLHVKLNGILEERGTENPWGEILGEEVSTIGLNRLLAAIERTTHDNRIHTVLVEAGMLTDAQPGQLEELREALENCKKAGKRVIAYADNYTQSGYYVCSMADRVLINPLGRLAWRGMAAQPIFYKDLLEKVGVKMDVFRVGTYKAAVEPFTETEMSAANRAQVSAYLHSIWQTMLEEVADSRRLTPETLNAYAERNLSYVNAEELKQLGMVDELCYRDGLRERLKRLAGVGEKEALNLLDANEVEEWNNTPQNFGDRIAVYYACGDITDTETSMPTPAIEAQQVMKDLDELRTDENVKAVVLRIHSGGGSAFGSEQLWHEVKRLREVKPVVVSMSGMAASGAYYLACAANHIVARPGTLTGSIGIFGMYPDATELLTDKLGLHFDVVKTNAQADMGNIGRALNTEERHALQTYVEEGYQLFVQRVAEGRKMTPQQVEALAEGRVWTGRQALEKGLVDELGGLPTAVRRAAQAAKVKDFTVEHLPKEASWIESIWGEARHDYLENKLRTAAGMYYNGMSLLRRLHELEPVQARLPFDPNLTN